jgi:predicted ribosome quality control (RQC) complex YloA/Tae2 family protein
MFNKIEKAELIQAIYTRIGELENNLNGLKAKQKENPYWGGFGNMIRDVEVRIELNKKLADKVDKMETFDDTVDKLNKSEAKLNEENR